jgi:hypothetical protein
LDARLAVVDVTESPGEADKEEADKEEKKWGKVLSGVGDGGGCHVNGN